MNIGLYTLNIVFMGAIAITLMWIGDLISGSIIYSAMMIIVFNNDKVEE